MFRAFLPIEYAIVLILAGVTHAQQRPEPDNRPQRQPPPPTPRAENPPTGQRQVTDGAPLLRGPVHEAFAAPVVRQPVASEGYAELPPEPPQESLPSVAPRDSDSARWIPGYWGWDVREQKYLWVSGAWRNAPPEMEWVPGYWATVKGEARWVPGFWTHGEDEELAYLPPPPALKNEQPKPAPDDQHFWVPGNWQYVEDQYQWKPGFWAPRREGLLWTPDCYVWSPRGYVFARGYWDYPLEQRGILFAPIDIAARVPERVTPSVVIDLREALAHWFVAPSYRHFCFGDYYEATRRPGSLISWYDERSATDYDGLRAYYASHDAKTFASWKTKHVHCQQDASLRPAYRWHDNGTAQAGRLAFSIASERLPAGIVRWDSSAYQVGTVVDYYRDILDRRAEFEGGAVIVDGRPPVFAQFEKSIPPGHGGLPPGQAKKGLVPPGFGGIPPGQAKKMIDSFGPIYEKSPKYKEKYGKPGKGKGKGK